MRKLLLTTVLAMACTQVLRAETIEFLGQPCWPINVLSGRMVSDPVSGKQQMLLITSNEASNLEMLFIDPVADTGKVVKAPAGQGAWMLHPIAGDRLVIGTHYDGKLMIYNLRSGEFEKIIQVPGEKYVWDGAVGSDGRLYVGGYPKASLAALDLATLELETFDCPTTNHQYLRYVTPTADGRLVCLFGMGDMTNRIFDPKTKTFSEGPKELEPLKLASLWNGFIVTENRVYDGTALTPVGELPFPKPPEKWMLDRNLTTSETLVVKAGTTVYRFKKGMAAWEKVAEWDAKIPGAVRGILPDGRVVGTLGQEYFVVGPEGEVVPKKIPVKTGVRPSHFIAADNKGKLWGGPWFGQTLWHMDLETTSNVVNTNVISWRGGEVYDVAFKNDKVYSVAYVGGEVIEYDPAKPFDLLKGNNPRTIASLGGNYIRPNAGVELGPDGLLYSGWMAQYGRYGGAVMVTDPEDPKGSKSLVIENPVGQQAITGIEVTTDTIFIGTSLAGNGVVNNPQGMAQIAMLDLKGEVKWKQDVSVVKTGSAAEFVYDEGANILGLEAGGVLCVFNPETKELKVAPGLEALPMTGTAAGDHNGQIIYGSEDKVVVYGMKDEAVKRTVTMPCKVEKVAVDNKGIIYVSGGVDVYRVVP